MTHSVGNVVGLSANVPTKTISDFSIVERDDPNRPAVYASGDLYTFLATTRETGFNFNFFDFFLPVNGGPPPHYHPFEHEAWYLTDGEFQFNLGDLNPDNPNTTMVNLVVPEGTTVFSPRNTLHGYRNLDSTASVIAETAGARTLSFTTPGALDLFFDAAAVRVQDRDDPIPGIEAPTPEDFFNLAKFAARTNAGIVLGVLDPNFVPPEGTLDYHLVLPDDASEDLINEAQALVGEEGFSIWTTGDFPGIPQRPSFIGDFGVEYTSLISLEESGGEFSYNQFSLNTGTELSEAVTSLDHQLFYVNEGTLSLEINGQVEVLRPDTFAYVAPGNEYSIANFDDETVKSLAITVENIESPNPSGKQFKSPLSAQSSVVPQQIVSLGSDGNFFTGSNNPNSYRYLFDDVIGFTDYVESPVVVDGIQFDGYFNGEVIQNGVLVDTPQGVYRVPIGKIGESDSLIEIYRDNYRVAGFEDGIIGQYFSGSPKSLDKVPEVIELLPEYYQEGLAPDFAAILPFDNPPDVFDYVVIPSAEFAFPIFRDTEGNPAPIVGQGYSVEAFESRRRIYGGEGDDELYAIKEDRIFGEAGNDIIDASRGFGGNRLYGGTGNDEIFVNLNDRAFGGGGNNLLDASLGNGGNYLRGGDGNDILIAGSRDELHGGNGNDILQVRGSDNLLYGGGGANQFWIADGSLPSASPVEYPEGTNNLLPPGLILPNLIDTNNTIMDFKLGVDKIHIKGIEEIAASFEDLQLLPTFGDMGSTSIIASYLENNTEKEISLANVAGIIFNELSANDFVFA